MSGRGSALYTPYGAFELKASYQRNLATSTALVAGFVGLGLLTSWAVSLLNSDETIVLRPEPIKTYVQISPPPRLDMAAPKIEASKTSRPQKVGVPTPVDDDLVVDDNAVLPSRDELEQMIPSNLPPENGDLSVILNDAEEDYIPPRDSFIILEIYPEMIKETTPVYPALARQAGLEGSVWVQALVNKEGKVQDAVIARSSGIPALDESALEAAHKNLFKPGIQNGKPVICWVSYKVVFKLAK